MKKVSIVPTVVIGVIGICVGFLLAFVAGVMLSLLCIFCGILTLLAGIPQLVNALNELVSKRRAAIFDLIMSVITVAAGIMLIFSHNNKIMMIIVGVYLILLPLIRILVAQDKSEQIKSELPAIILGVALVLIGPGAAVDLVFKIAGALVIIFSVLYIIFGIVAYNKAVKLIESADSGAKTYVDTDGNGIADTVYIDVDGDGAPDLEVEIGEPVEEENKDN